MGYEFDITPPSGEDDIKGAERVFEGFLTLYQPTLLKVNDYLENIMHEVGPTFARAYLPWQLALRDLYRGVFLVTKKIELPDTERFIEALKTFSFQGAIQFLFDLCTSCRIAVSDDWIKKFHQHIHLLLFSISILNRGQQPSVVR